MLLTGLLVAPAMAQTDPAGRVGRLNHAEGTVTSSPAGDNEWTEAEANRPVTRGDRLWTNKASRAEVQIGSSAVRMDAQTQLEILALDDQSAQISLTQGTVHVRVRSLPEGENFEIDTPNLAYRAAYPGDYRIDVDAARGTTRVTIHSGTGTVYGENGQALPLGGGQQITFRGRTLAKLAAQESPPQDNFDRWAAERNRREDQSVSARYVPREVVGYQSLDAHGQWTQDATHGAVWFPQGTSAKWAPYRDGRWEWIAPWGWTWIDDAPWGFAPSHYGRWAMIGSRWGWVPGRIALRPIYAPALVAFIGGGSAATPWSIPVAAGRPGIAWFPLAPGEAWQPGYPASPFYISSVNRNMPPQAGPSWAHQARPEALTAMTAEDFHRGRPVRGSWLRVAGNALAKAQIVAPPPMPADKAFAARERPVNTARAAPTTPADIRPVTAAAQASPQQQQTSQQLSQLEQGKSAEQAKVAEQARAAQQAKSVEQAKAAEQAKVTQQARLVEQARAAESARRAQRAKAQDDLKRDRLAKRAEPARRELLLARQREQLLQRELAKRAESSREEQARRSALALMVQREDKARREAHAQQVEQARRAADRDAQVLREQREQARREAQDREQLARREAQEREQQAQREAWERQQQAISEQWRRDQQAWEQQRARQRPDLRNDRRSAQPPEVWQRGIQILTPGRTS